MKIKKYIAIPLLSLFLAASAFFTGAQAEKRYTAAVMVKKETINIIAVVNLDEGIKVGDSQVNYAAQLLKFPGGNFVSAGLSEARAGILNGKYAAYVIIPTTFSESVESINTVPAQALLEYDINPKLKDAVKELIIEDLHSFQTLLNTDVAYLYLSAILEEFHEVQDASDSIMKRDTQELNTLEEVSAEELVQPLAFSEMRRIDNTVEEADLSDITAENEKTVKEISKEYSDYVEEGRTEYVNVKEGRKEVKDSSDRLMSHVKKADPLTDSNGKSTIKNGIAGLETAVDKYNTKQKDQRNSVNERILEAVGNKKEKDQRYLDSELKSIAEDLQTNVDSYRNDSTAVLQAQADDQLRVIQEENVSKVNTKLVEFQNKLTGFVYTDLQKYTNDQLIRILMQMHNDYANAVNTQLEDYQKAVKEASLLYWRDAVQTINQVHYEQLTESILSQLRSLEGETLEEVHIRNVGTALAGGNPPNLPESVDGSVITVNADVILPELTFEEDSAKWQEIKQEFDLTKAPVKLPDLTGTGISLKKAVSASEQEKDPKTQVWIELTPDGYTIPKPEVYLPDAEKNAADKQVKEIESYYTISKKEITDTIDKKIVDVIKEENAQERKEIGERGKDLESQMKIYESALTSFDPYKYLTGSVLETGASKLNTNLLKAQTKVNKTGTEYLKLVSDVYQAADQNVLDLQQDMEIAAKITSGNVIHRIELLKSSRKQINQENVDILKSFAGKLKYTRVGYLPYKEAYDFIINPIRLKE